ncbi:MAG: hypothetical protein QM767_23490 [Anaeromyxobacter sp.]
MDPNVTAPEQQPPRTPPFEAVDLDRANRPGHPKERAPQPWPNSRPDPVRQRGRSAVPRHGRAHKPFPPVFSTALPPRGLSGAIRRAAYRLPDHVTNHWLLLLLADRVESWGKRTRRALAVAVPAAAAALLVRRWVATR